MEILNYSLLVFGMFFICMSFIVHTSNFKSAVVFKIFPFFGGVNCVIVALTNLNVINIFH